MVGADRPLDRSRAASRLTISATSLRQLWGCSAQTCESGLGEIDAKNHRRHIAYDKLLVISNRTFDRQQIRL